MEKTRKTLSIIVGIFMGFIAFCLVITFFLLLPFPQYNIFLAILEFIFPAVCLFYISYKSLKKDTQD